MIVPGGDSPLARVRVGCDVVALAEIANSLSRFGERYLRRVFTAGEVDECTGVNRIPRLAARFAAKEATIKAFAAPESHFPLTEIEVVNVGPLPSLRLSGSVARLAAVRGWGETSVSLSHTDCHAAAVVAVLCADMPADLFGE